MNDKSDGRSASSGPNEDWREVFSDMLDATADQVGGSRPDAIDAPELQPVTDGLRNQGMVPTLAPEISETMDWTRSLVGGLQSLDDIPNPNGHVQSQRTRLRRVLYLINRYMSRHPELSKLSYRNDIAILGAALDALNSGTTHPLLATQAMNRPPNNAIDQHFRAYAVSFVHLLALAEVRNAKAFKMVAEEFTKAGFSSSRISEKNPDFNFRSDTIRRWYHNAQPNVERRTEFKDPEAVRTERHGQHDSQVVFKLLNSFAINAIHVDDEPLPPSKSYVLKVIQATLNHPTTRSLFALRL